MQPRQRQNPPTLVPLTCSISATKADLANLHFAFFGLPFTSNSSSFARLSLLSYRPSSIISTPINAANGFGNLLSSSKRFFSCASLILCFSCASVTPFCLAPFRPTDILTAALCRSFSTKPIVFRIIAS